MAFLATGLTTSTALLMKAGAPEAGTGATQLGDRGRMDMMEHLGGRGTPPHTSPVPAAQHQHRPVGLACLALSPQPPSAKCRTWQSVPLSNVDGIDGRGVFSVEGTGQLLVEGWAAGSAQYGGFDNSLYRENRQLLM